MGIQVTADVLTVDEQMRVRAIGGQGHMDPAFNLLGLLEIMSEKRMSRVVVLPPHHESTVDVVGSIRERHTIVEVEYGASS